MNGKTASDRAGRVDPPSRWRMARVACVLTAGMVGLAVTVWGSRAQAADTNSLKSIEFAALPGDRVQLHLGMSEDVAMPSSFTMGEPPRVTMDFPNTRLGLQRKTVPVGVGMVQSVSAVEAMGRTRVVLNLVRPVRYETRVSGNNVFVTVEGGGAEEESAAVAIPSDRPAIRAIDFRRGDAGEGRVLVRLSDPEAVSDVRQEGDKILVDFKDVYLPEELNRRLDVVDFATPVKMVDTAPRDRGARMEISTTTDEFEYLSYQAEDLLTVEFRPLTKAEKEAIERERFQYTGERLSLNFQDIEVRAVLQLLADFTDLNMVTSDTVGGSITLRLKNVPWDQALDIILRTKGLSKRQDGNVILIAPTEEIAAREKLELEVQRQTQELAPLRSEFIQVNYASADDLASLLKSTENRLISERGSVTVDERTNTLLVQDTSAKLAEIRAIVTRLDIPVRQVLIESRIVIANNDFSRELGVRFGATYVQEKGSRGLMSTTGTARGNNTIVESAIDNLQNSGQIAPVDVPPLLDRLNVDLPVVNPAGSIGLAILGSDFLLDLELSALQNEGRGEIISSPRLITSDQSEAVIKQGFEIPYQEASSAGNTSTAFKEAVLSLQVTPKITPDDRVNMDLKVNKDNPDFGRALNDIPPIDTRSITTSVLVDNGETVVLGGIYEHEFSDNQEKVPLFGDIPVLGHLFKNTRNQSDQRELLIFVTPKIIKETLSLR